MARKSDCRRSIATRTCCGDDTPSADDELAIATFWQCVLEEMMCANCAERAKSAVHATDSCSSPSRFCNLLISRKCHYCQNTAFKQ